MGQDHAADVANIANLESESNPCGCRRRRHRGVGGKTPCRSSLRHLLPERMSAGGPCWRTGAVSALMLLAPRGGSGTPPRA
jgi:hypothetical protein